MLYCPFLTAQDVQGQTSVEKQKPIDEIITFKPTYPEKNFDHIAKKYYQEKRAKKLEGQVKTEAPVEWAKIERMRRTPSDREAPEYMSNYIVQEYNRAIQNKRLSRGALDATFYEHGPGNVAGRTRALLMDSRDSSGNTWIAGSASGGAWKTEDGGRNWTHLTPELMNLGTNTLASSPSNPDIIYLGTGEHFISDIDGSGMFKSDDGGQSWYQIASPEQYPGFRNVSRIVVDPDNPDVVIVTVSGSIWSQRPDVRAHGIYKTTDGGQTWTLVLDATEIGRCDDLVPNPKNFSTLYAAIDGFGFAKSTDTGNTWTTIPLEYEDPEGRPNQRIEIDVSPVDTNLIWASVEPFFLFYSKDGGLTWITAHVIEEGARWDFLQQGFFDNIVMAHPFDSLSVYVGGSALYRFSLDEDQSDTLSYFSFQASDQDVYDSNFIIETQDFTSNLFNGNIVTSSVELRMGQGGQLAHRISPSGPDQVELVQIPFQAWDTTNNVQLAMSFVDVNDDGVFGFTETLDPNDPAAFYELEELAINYTPYSDTIDPEIASNYLLNSTQRYNLRTFFSDLLDSLPELSLGWYVDLDIGSSVTNHYLGDPYFFHNGNNNFGNQGMRRGYGLHPDQHGLLAHVIDSSTGEFRILVGNDGGVYVSDTSFYPGETDSSFHYVSTGYNTTQFYGADKAPGSERYIGGTQDNGTWFMPEETIQGAGNEYVFGIGGDGFEVQWNQRNADHIIGGSQFNGFARTMDGGQTWSGFPSPGRAPFVTRITSSASNPERIYGITREGIIRSDDFGENWETFPLANGSNRIPGFTNSIELEVSLADPDVIWAAGFHDSEPFTAVVSENAGEDARLTNGFDGQTFGVVSGLGTHPYDRNTAYILYSFSGRPKVIRTTDLGETWEDISGFDSTRISTRGFPDVATNCIFVFPNDTHRIWVGTEIGIVESTNNGDSWNLITDDFGALNVHQMTLRDDKIVIATYGRGIWSASVDGLIAEEIVFVPLIQNVLNDLKAQETQASVLYSNDFDSSSVYLNGILFNTDTNILASTINVDLPRGLLLDGQNTIIVKAYFADELYESTEYIYENTKLLSALTSYSNSFEDSFNDIEFGYSGITTVEDPLGFEDRGRSLQTDHPYSAGENLITQLRHPIIVENQVLSYDDIALVEPGELGLEFGNFGFWDYVAVEATTDGVNWVTLKGYDARYSEPWLNAYFDGVGSQDLDTSYYEHHEINLRDYFEEDDVILIRFRLFSDGFVEGWGWLVDNVEIENPVTSSGNITNELDFALNVSPNPTNDFVKLQIQGNEQISEVQIIDTHGKTVGSYNGFSLNEYRLDLTALPAGSYFVRSKVDGKNITSKVIKN